MWGTWPLCQGMPPSYWSRWLGDRRSWQEPSSKPKNPSQPQLWCPQVLLLSSSPKYCECLARPLDLFCSGSQTELLSKPVVFCVFEDRRPTSYTHPPLCAVAMLCTTMHGFVPFENMLQSGLPTIEMSVTQLWWFCV